MRISWSTSDPTNPGALDPAEVAAVVAGIVKKVLVNPDGLWNESTAEGPFSRSRTFRGSRQTASSNEAAGDLGDLEVTAADLAKLAPSVVQHMPGTIRLNPALAPPCTPGGVDDDGQLFDETEAGVIYGPYYG